MEVMHYKNHTFEGGHYKKQCLKRDDVLLIIGDFVC